MCFIPPPSRTLDPSLPASGLHRHLSASLSLYVSGVLFCQSLGEGTCTFQNRCHFTPGSPGWECSLSQVTPAESVVCPPSASGCREYQLLGKCPCQSDLLQESALRAPPPCRPWSWGFGAGFGYSGHFTLGTPVILDPLGAPGRLHASPCLS